MPCTLVSHTNAHTIRGRLTLEDVERFQNGSVHEFYIFKALKFWKMWIPQMLKKSWILMSRTWMLRETTTSEAHWIKRKIFNETTWTVKYLSLTLVLKSWMFSLFLLESILVNGLILKTLSLLLLYYHSIDRCHANFVNRHTRTYFRLPVHQDISEGWFALCMELHVLGGRHVKFSWGLWYTRKSYQFDLCT